MKILPSALLKPFPEVTALFTTRHGGISKSPYTNANFAFHVGDDPHDVIKNHDLLAEQIGYHRHSLIHMRQIHSDRIVIVEDSFNFDTPPRMRCPHHRPSPYTAYGDECRLYRHIDL